jgi:hypothetical protein
VQRQRVPLSHATATRMRLRFPTMQLVGRNPPIPAPGRYACIQPSCFHHLRWRFRPPPDEDVSADEARRNPTERTASIMSTAKSRQLPLRRRSVSARALELPFQSGADTRTLP